MISSKGPAATSTVALLASLGVAQGQSIEGVGTGALGRTAATAVSQTAESAVGVSVGSVRRYIPLPTMLSLSTASFWRRAGGTLIETTLSASTTGDVTAVARGGLFACGFGLLSGAGARRWTKGGASDEILGLDGTSFSAIPLAITADGGLVVGGSFKPGGDFHAFAWIAPFGPALDLGDLAGGGSLSMATAVTPDGTMIAGMSDSGGPDTQWFRFEGGFMQPLPVYGEVHGISANGAVVVGQDLDGNALAWIGGVVQPIGVRGYALGSNDAGTVIVGTDAAAMRAWLWTPAAGARPLDQAMADLGLAPPTDMLAARDVSPCGDLVVGWMGNGASAEPGDAPDGPFTGTPPDANTRMLSGQTDGLADGRDAWLIDVIDPADFYATTSPAVDAQAQASFDTRLWLFDPGGNVVVANDDAPGGIAQATVSSPATFAALTGGAVAATAPASLAPGQYILVIAGAADDPLDAGAVPLADLAAAPAALHGDDPAAGAFAGWRPGPHAGGAYTIVLRGVAGSTLAPQQGYVLDRSTGADIDGNGVVDVVDFLALLQAWGPCPCCAADIDGNGAVDIVDFLLLLQAWG